MIIKYTKKENNWYNINKLKYEKCKKCGGNGDVLDHVVPFVLTGDDTESNFQRLCRECNKRKTAIDNKIIWCFKRLGFLVPITRFSFEMKLNKEECIELYNNLYKKLNKLY